MDTIGKQTSFEICNCDITLTKPIQVKTQRNWLFIYTTTKDPIILKCDTWDTSTEKSDPWKSIYNWYTTTTDPIAFISMNNREIMLPRNIILWWEVRILD